MWLTIVVRVSVERCSDGLCQPTVNLDGNDGVATRLSRGGTIETKMAYPLYLYPILWIHAYRRKVKRDVMT